MSEFRRATVQLTIKYSLIFFVFIWLFSGGIYIWVNNSLGEGYVNRINNVLEQQHSSTNHQIEVSDSAASIATDITLDKLRNILLAINVAALFVVPLLAYFTSKRTLNPLIESQQSQQRFVANASHELRTPLAVILADLDWATRKQRSVAEYKTTLNNAKTEVQYMSTLITSLLTLARLSDTNNPIREPVAIDVLIQDVMTQYDKAAETHLLSFHTDLKARLISGDRKLLEIVVRNLIDNAVKYAEPNTTIEIATQTTKGITTLIIRNTTTELSSDQLIHFFDRFYQGATHHTHEGFGLGLAIVKQILDASEGSIDARYIESDQQVEMRITLK